MRQLGRLVLGMGLGAIGLLTTSGLARADEVVDTKVATTPAKMRALLVDSEDCFMGQWWADRSDKNTYYRANLRLFGIARIQVTHTQSVEYFNGNLIGGGSIPRYMPYVKDHVQFILTTQENKRDIQTVTLNCDGDMLDVPSLKGWLK